MTTSLLLGDADTHIMPTQAWLQQYLPRKHQALAAQAIPAWEHELQKYDGLASQRRAQLGSQQRQFAKALQGPKSLFAPGALDPPTRSQV